MVKNRFTKKQKLLIIKLCRIQLESISRVCINKSYRVAVEELEELGLQVESSDYKQILKRQQILFEKAIRNPNRIYEILGEHNISVLKHVLFNFTNQNKKVVKNLWRKLFLCDKVNEINQETLSKYPIKLSRVKVEIHLNYN